MFKYPTWLVDPKGTLPLLAPKLHRLESACTLNLMYVKNVPLVSKMKEVLRERGAVFKAGVVD